MLSIIIIIFVFGSCVRASVLIKFISKIKINNNSMNKNYIEAEDLVQIEDKKNKFSNNTVFSLKKIYRIKLIYYFIDSLY